MWTRCLVLLVTTLALTSYTEGLQCLSCTYIKADADIPGAASAAISALLDAVQNPECSEVGIDESTNGVTKETCSPPKGQVSKCANYQGKLKVEVNLLLFKPSVALSIYNRGCHYETQALMPRDDCHDQKIIQSDKNIFQGILNMFTSILNFVQFKGNLCICSTDVCNSSPSTCVSSPMMLFVIIVVKRIC